MGNQFQYCLGMSLIEILISLSILGGILMGIISWQNFSLRQVQNAYYQDIAMMQAESLMERFRANLSNEGLKYEFDTVQKQISNFLPQGTSDYQCSLIDHTCTVSVSWQDHGPKTLSLSSFL